MNYDLNDKKYFSVRHNECEDRLQILVRPNLAEINGPADRYLAGLSAHLAIIQDDMRRQGCAIEYILDLPVKTVSAVVKTRSQRLEKMTE